MVHVNRALEGQCKHFRSAVASFKISSRFFFENELGQINRRSRLWNTIFEIHFFGHLEYRLCASQTFLSLTFHSNIKHSLIISFHIYPQKLVHEQEGIPCEFIITFLVHCLICFSRAPYNFQSLQLQFWQLDSLKGSNGLWLEPPEIIKKVGSIKHFKLDSFTLDTEITSRGF